MKRVVKYVAVLALVAVAGVGCGSFSEANSYNVPIRQNVDAIRWVRLDSPSNYPTIVRGCYGGDGIYLTQDTGQSVEVVPNDPACAGQ